MARVLSARMSSQGVKARSWNVTVIWSKSTRKVGVEFLAKMIRFLNAIAKITSTQMKW